MMTYLLLRNNKETGPLSLEALRETGLRPTDLVWVEGQSVCWLSPGEIRELKNLVSIEEKQPLLQKPAEDTIPLPDTITVEKNAQLISIPVKETNPIAANDGMEAYMPHVEPEIISPVLQPPVSAKQTVIAETKYSRPLDELKELYAESLEKRIKKRNFSLVIPPQLKKAGLYAAFIATGIFAGILIGNSGKRKKAENTAPLSQAPSVKTATENSQAETVQPLITAEQVPVSSVEPDRSASLPFPEEKVLTEDIKGRSVKSRAAANARSEENEASERNSENRTTLLQNIPETPVREKKVISANEIASLVTVKSNDYIVGSFGGIKNLQLTVTNTSGYVLDRVVVEVQYLKPRDEFLKAENIQFLSIAPNGSQTLAVPKSTRGVKVRYRVIRVESDQISGTTAGN